MSARTILCVFGTRPEAIKMAPVVRALAARAGEFRPVVCVTNQHQEMLDQVLDLFELRVEHRLQVMTSGQTPNDVTVRVLERLPPVLADTRPAAVLVQGDTTTTFAAALASFYDRIPIGHVEAGLRTYRKDSPFPEELNRQMTTVLADWHFAPTAWARDNLLRAGVAPAAITVTGNPVTDALRWIADKVADGADVVPALAPASRVVLVTAHRRENFGPPFVAMCEAMRAIVERHPDVELVYPVHLNPNVQEPVRRILSGVPRVHLPAPVDYASLVALLKRCTLVLTDSGGIQEEAPSLGKPVLVMRDTTERPEGVEAGTAKLVGTDRDRIVAEADRLLTDPAAYAAMAHAHNPYGDGHAGEAIVAALAAGLAENGS
ncbi:MAG: UDP-N-acetylglucosamine 2-epimerase (non-hydrolyzing) [Deltaproteobacteria bacterium]|nr:UDP-N-acetylglucosamine 2-epimerase (non-hydrolyzing) [Deltaproteobacteria bacterium]